MKRIAIIGAGVFGICAALELKKRGFEVVLFEKNSNILESASTINHLRHHYGYHYPRSKETVEEIKNCSQLFLDNYGKCVDRGMTSYYAISNKESKVTPEQFLKFCDEMKLPYEIEYPDEDIINRSSISLCIRTPEPVYSPKKLSEMMLKSLKEKKIDLRLKTTLIEGDVKDKIKKLRFFDDDFFYNEEFDIILNATYSRINEVNKMLNLPKIKVQYELMEMLELEIPRIKRYGLTIIDGEFSSIMPRDTGTYALADVKYSVLNRITSDHLSRDVVVRENIPSNKDMILKRAIYWYPFLKDSKFIRSLYTTKVVKAHVDNTDERLTEIKKYLPGVYSIFGGKVITCVDTANKIADDMQKSQQ
jgi:hypothetical protein